MKKIISAVVAIALIAGLFVTGAVKAPMTISEAAAVEATENRLSVNGEGVVQVTPDMAYINIGVVTEDKDASVAQSENAKLMTNVKIAIMEAGIEEDDMQTMNYSIYKSYNYFDDKEREEVYKASNTQIGRAHV